MAFAPTKVPPQGYLYLVDDAGDGESVLPVDTPIAAAFGRHIAKTASARSAPWGVPVFATGGLLTLDLAITFNQNVRRRSGLLPLRRGTIRRGTPAGRAVSSVTVP